MDARRGGRLPDPVRAADRPGDPAPGRHRGHPQPPARRRPLPRRRRRRRARRVPRAEPAHRPGPRPAPRGPRDGPRRPDLVVMSATMDAEPVARFLGDCPSFGSRAGRSRSRSIPTGRPCRPRRPRRSSPPSRRSRRAGMHRATSWCSCPVSRRSAGPAGGSGRSPSAQGLLVLPLHGSLPARGPGPGPAAGRAAQGRPGDEHRRDLADDRRGGHGDRQRPGAFASFDPSAGSTGWSSAGSAGRRPTQRAGRAGGPRRGVASGSGPSASIAGWPSRTRPRSTASISPRRSLPSTPGDRPTRRGSAGSSRPPPIAWPRPSGCSSCSGPSIGEGGGSRRLGRQLLDLPVHPRLGRLLIASAADGLLREGAALAALLSEKDIVAQRSVRRAGPRARQGAGSSDLLVRLDLLDEAERARFRAGGLRPGIDPGRGPTGRAGPRRPRTARPAAAGGAPSPGAEPDEETMLRWVLLAYPDRVVRRRGPSDGDGRDGRRPRGPARPRVGRPRRRVLPRARPPRGPPRRHARSPGPDRQRDCGSSGWRSSSPSAIRRERSVTVRRGRAAGRRREHASGIATLLLREDRHAAGRACRGLGRPWPRPSGPARRTSSARDEAAASWLARLALLHRARCPKPAWPDFDDAGPRRRSSPTPAPASGASRRSSATPLVPLLKGRLTHAQSRLLDEHAPEALTVPSGQPDPPHLRTRSSPGPRRPAPGTLRLDRNPAGCGRPGRGRAPPARPELPPRPDHRRPRGASGRPPTSRSARTSAPDIPSTPGPTTPSRPEPRRRDAESPERPGGSGPPMFPLPPAASIPGSRSPSQRACSARKSRMTSVTTRLCFTRICRYSPSVTSRVQGLSRTEVLDESEAGSAVTKA